MVGYMGPCPGQHLRYTVIMGRHEASGWNTTHLHLQFRPLGDAHPFGPGTLERDHIGGKHQENRQGGLCEMSVAYHY